MANAPNAAPSSPGRQRSRYPAFDGGSLLHARTGRRRRIQRCDPRPGTPPVPAPPPPRPATSPAAEPAPPPRCRKPATTDRRRSGSFPRPRTSRPGPQATCARTPCRPPYRRATVNTLPQGSKGVVEPLGLDPEHVQHHPAGRLDRLAALDVEHPPVRADARRRSAAGCATAAPRTRRPWSTEPGTPRAARARSASRPPASPRNAPRTPGGGKTYDAPVHAFWHPSCSTDSQSSARIRPCAFSDEHGSNSISSMHLRTPANSSDGDSARADNAGRVATDEGAAAESSGRRRRPRRCGAAAHRRQGRHSRNAAGPHRRAAASHHRTTSRGSAPSVPARSAS